jgi:hypothetical protein
MQQAWAGPSFRTYGLWVITCAAAELIGIGAAAAWWVTMDLIAPDPVSLAGKATMLVSKSLSGLFEGTVLGVLQAVVLRRIYPHLSLPHWVVLTVSLAIFGWAVGSAIPMFGAFSDSEPVEPPMNLLLGFASIFGLLVGALFGAVQALALRQAARRSHWWITVNAAGWAVALPVIYFGASLPDESATTAQVIAAGLVSGILAGTLLGAVTGLAFRHMEPK